MLCNNVSPSMICSIETCASYRLLTLWQPAEPDVARADYEALRSDWLAVGDYIAEAIAAHKEAICC